MWLHHTLTQIAISQIYNKRNVVPNLFENRSKLMNPNIDLLFFKRIIAGKKLFHNFFVLPTQKQIVWNVHTKETWA